MHHSILRVCNQPDQILIGGYSKWEGDKFVFQGIWAQGTFQIIGWTVLEAEPKVKKHMKCIRVIWLGSRRRHDAGPHDRCKTLVIEGRRQPDCKTLRLTPFSVSLTQTRGQMVMRRCWSRVISLPLSQLHESQKLLNHPSKEDHESVFKNEVSFEKRSICTYIGNKDFLKRAKSYFRIFTSILRLLESRNRIYYLVCFSKNNKRSIRTPGKNLPFVFVFHMILGLKIQYFLFPEPTVAVSESS